MKQEPRIDEMLALLGEASCPVMIRGEKNLRYLTGFVCDSCDCILLAGRDRRVLLADSIAYEPAKAQVDCCEIISWSGDYQSVAAFLREEGADTLSVENSVLTVAEFQALERALPGVHLMADGSLDGAVAELRKRKTPYELEQMRRAQRITDDVFTFLLTYIRPGRTEREIAFEMEMHGRSLGADSLAFAIVASGENGALAHALVSDRVLQSGELMVMDYGFYVNGYCSDMTRTVAVGRASAKQREAYAIVQEAQALAMEAVAPGVACTAIDKLARDVIDGTRFAGRFNTSLGHSLGMDVHERPYLGRRDDGVLDEGMCVTVEPGIYVPGEFGVRIEDMLLCTHGGHENLTKSDRSLMELL